MKLLEFFKTVTGLHLIPIIFDQFKKSVLNNFDCSVQFIFVRDILIVSPGTLLLD